MKFIMTVILFIIITFGFTVAQVVTAVAPLKPGNKWVYNLYLVGDYTRAYPHQFEVTDSTKLIKNITFYAVNIRDTGFPVYTGYFGKIPDQLFARYDIEISDSLYTYFKINPEMGDTWEQQWKNGITLYNTIIDTFTAKVFNKNTLIYEIDRRDISLIYGSREYWTKEYGMLNGIYEQAEDILKGCVIDGVLYGDTTVTGTEEVKEFPNKFILYQNYPNPFNPYTIISWELVTGSNVRLEIYNILGEKIKTLTDEYHNPGKYNITLNAEELPSAIYFYRLITEDFSQTKKMIYLK